MVFYSMSIIRLRFDDLYPLQLRAIFSAEGANRFTHITNELILGRRVHNFFLSASARSLFLRAVSIARWRISSVSHRAFS
jgi:hypothetical protein